MQTDKFRLYRDAFQSPVHEMAIIDRLFESETSAQPSNLREDFCGAAANCIAWVGQDREKTAVGVDIDEAPIDWCRQNMLSALDIDQQDNISFDVGNVLDHRNSQYDVIIALNSSFCVFKTREVLARYFACCHDALFNPGMLVLELFAGPEAYSIGTDRLNCDGFIAIWEQYQFDFLTNECINYIHFETDAGQVLERAFEYDWRLWTPAELVELLTDCGFLTKVFRKLDLGKCKLDECKFLNIDSCEDIYVVGFK